MSERPTRPLGILLRRLRVFERRWIPDRLERERHTELVRDRIAPQRPDHADGNDPA